MILLEFPNKKYEGYIFDCDGTLADAMPLHHQTWNQALTQHGAKFEFTWKLMQILAGMGAKDTIAYLNNKFKENLDYKVIHATKVRLFQKGNTIVNPINDVVNFAKECKEKDLPIAVCSGGCKQNVHKTLNLLGIKNLFDFIFTQEDVNKGKPDPEMFLNAAKAMKTDPKNCLVFEDAPKGIEAAKAAGMDYVLIEHKK